MRLRSPRTIAVAVPPLFFWERHRKDMLRIQNARSFHPYHATTLLCLEMLEETLFHGRCDRLLDVGCGSGILALTAAYFGIASVVGIDISPRAIRESCANAGLNELSTKCSWVVGSTGTIRGCFPCVVANLRTDVLTGLMGDLARLTCRGEGRLIVSGFHDIEWPTLEIGWQALGMESERVLSKDQSFYGVPPSGSFTWCAVRLRHTT
jgi:ribosomal protein L11 methylase PrmA